MKDKKTYITAIITLSITSLVFAVALIVTLSVPSKKDKALEAELRKSFYETVTQVDNVDLNLSKSLATKDSGSLQKYLVDTAINSELLESNLQSLPLNDEDKYYTVKLVNQISDFCKYLNEKIIDAENLSDEDKENLYNLYLANLSLKEALQTITEELDGNFNFSNMLNTQSKNIITDNFSDLQNLSVTYPKLIYDGPFSDSQGDREILGLNDEEITEQQALETFYDIFENAEKAKVVSVTEGDIRCYNIEGKRQDNPIYANVSVKGGKLLMFTDLGSCKEVNIDIAEAEEKALNFMEKLGIENMKAVWINLANNVFTVNLASTVNNIIIYPDLIKIRVCAETGTVIGLEATAYYTNHHNREIPSPLLSTATAKTKVSDNVEIDSQRLVLIPIGENSEKLCYEFMGRYNDITYYIYIDATSGKQAEMFKVVEGTEGMLLM